MGTTIPFRKRSTDVENPKQLSDKKVNDGKDSVFKIIFKQVFSTERRYVNDIW